MLRRRARKVGNTERSGTAAGPDADGPAARSGAPASPAANKVEPFTYIQKGTTIVGQLEARGRVRVHGLVRGDVKVHGALEVAEAGLVEGASIEADDVKIIGRVVVERLVAKGKVEIWDGGELIGDVRAASLDIEEGARFTGRSEMAGPDNGAAAPGEPGALVSGDARQNRYAARSMAPAEADDVADNLLGAAEVESQAEPL